MGLQKKQEVADQYKISVNTLNSWIAKGYGPKPIYLGRLVRFRAEDVDAFIKEITGDKKDGNDIEEE